MWQWSSEQEHDVLITRAILPDWFHGWDQSLNKTSATKKRKIECSLNNQIFNLNRKPTNRPTKGEDELSSKQTH